MRSELVDRQQAGLARARRGALALLAGTGSRPLPSADGPAVWPLLSKRCPALAEWASYFALCERDQAPTQRQVDDLVRDLPVFLDLVADRHG